MIPLLWPARQTFFFTCQMSPACSVKILLIASMVLGVLFFTTDSYATMLWLCCTFANAVLSVCMLWEEERGLHSRRVTFLQCGETRPYVSSMFWSVYNITHVPLWSHDSGHNFSYMVWFSFWIIPFSFYSIRIDEVPPDMKSMHTGSLLSHKFLSSQFLLLVQVVGKRQDWCCGKWSFRRTALSTVECSEEVTCYQDL